MHHKASVGPLRSRASKVRTIANLSAVILLPVIASVSCGGGTADPSAQVDEIFLEVLTQEYEPPRWLMTIGKTGSAHVLAFKDDVGVQPGRVTFGSSDPA